MRCKGKLVDQLSQQLFWWSVQPLDQALSPRMWGIHACVAPFTL